MTPPLLLVAAGILAVGFGMLILRSFGPGFRVGQLLASTPRVAVTEAIEIAERAEKRYVRVDGRVDAADEFEDENHRPLVFRRQRIEALRRTGWTVLDEQRRAVEFEVREGTTAIGVDQDALREGLVVIPRESVGRAADVPDLAGPDLPPGTMVRLRVEQISSVEHAIVLGQPVSASGGRIRLTAGLGRPLVLSTLDGPEAMRVLAGGARLRPFAATAFLGTGIALLAGGIAWSLADAVL